MKNWFKFLLLACTCIMAVSCNDDDLSPVDKSVIGNYDGKASMLYILRQEKSPLRHPVKLP